MLKNLKINKEKDIKAHMDAMKKEPTISLESEQKKYANPEVEKKSKEYKTLADEFETPE